MEALPARRADAASARSVVQLYGEYTGECGYCQGGQTTSFGLKSAMMRSEDYEALMYRGFRRCGDLFYKPVMHKVHVD